MKILLKLLALLKKRIFIFIFSLILWYIVFSYIYTGSVTFSSAKILLLQIYEKSKIIISTLGNKDNYNTLIFLSLTVNLGSSVFFLLAERLEKFEVIFTTLLPVDNGTLQKALFKRETLASDDLLQANDSLKTLPSALRICSCICTILAFLHPILFILSSYVSTVLLIIFSIVPISLSIYIAFIFAYPILCNMDICSIELKNKGNNNISTAPNITELVSNTKSSENVENTANSK